MLQKSKSKGKLQTNRAIQNLNNILTLKSPLRSEIDTIVKQLGLDKIQTIHSQQFDKVANANFLKTPYNCDFISKSFRSPYTNQYFPPSVDEDKLVFPSPIFRDLQQKGNIVFQQYGKSYYGKEGLICNFFVFQTEEGLNAAFYLKKKYEQESIRGVWCSSHIIQIRGDPVKSVAYKLQTTVVYQLKIKYEGENNYVNVSGTLKKNKVQAKKLFPEYQVDQFHILICGKMVQDTQILLRQQLESIFLAKTKEINEKNRFKQTKQVDDQRKKLAKELTKMKIEVKNIRNFDQ